MKQTARIISTYSADVFGVCSALFELGGMTVMHDASGCNSTYTTHDEPRWYDMDSMVYISGLTEMEAIMGDDEKLIRDIVNAAKELQPKFVAEAGTPIPTMTGFDFDSIAWMIEQETGIPSFGFKTTGMNTYVHGASMALEAYARRFVDSDAEKTEELSVNILGLTPLDFSVNGADASIEEFLTQNGYNVLSKWAMGSTPEELAKAGGAHVNLVVSAVGLGLAKALKELFGTPYVVGVPYGETCAMAVANALKQAVETGEDQLVSHLSVANLSETMDSSLLEDGQIVIIGEGVTSVSLAQAIELETGRGVRVLCTTECDAGLLRKKDKMTRDEEDVEEALAGAKVMIADPLFRPICPQDVRFVALPSEAFSGRLFREQIPNLISDLGKIKEEL